MKREEIKAKLDKALRKTLRKAIEEAFIKAQKKQKISAN
jgi:hypothetical protein